MNKFFLRNFWKIGKKCPIKFISLYSQILYLINPNKLGEMKMGEFIWLLIALVIIKNLLTRGV